MHEGKIRNRMANSSKQAQMILFGLRQKFSNTSIFRQHTDNKIDAHTKLQSNLLKRINLQITGSTEDHPKMFGTKVEFKRGEYQDPCAGDGGGPLMDTLMDSRLAIPVNDPGRYRWVLIG